MRHAIAYVPYLPYESEQSMNNHVRDDIINAFADLLSEKDFESISVKDLAQRAGVSRSTFYRHFDDKWDLMHQCFKSILDEAVYEESNETLRDVYYHVGVATEREMPRFAKALATRGEESLAYFIRDYSIEMIQRLVRDSAHKITYTESERFQLDFFYSGLAGVYETIVAGGYNLTPEERADAMYEMTPGFLKRIKLYAKPA